MDGTIGEIRLWAAGFEPHNWTYCDGKLLRIQYFEALFSLLGTRYGGDGVNTFGVPDLRGRTTVGAASGGQPILGATGGAENVSLTTAQLPVHTHGLQASALAGTVASPENAYPAGSNDQDLYGEASETAMGTAATLPAGGGQPHNNMMPFIGLNYVICLNGIYPYRAD